MTCVSRVRLLPALLLVACTSHAAASPPPPAARAPAGAAAAAPAPQPGPKSAPKPAPAPAQQAPAAQGAPQVAAGSQPALTIYNQDFAVVRETLPLSLGAGVNDVSVTGMTTSLEPDSVILRDPTGRRVLQVLEQNYRADPVSEALLLSLFEGQTIDFLVTRGDVQETVRGKIVRSGYVPRYAGNPYNPYQQPVISEPIIEVNGRLRFSLPGQPLFPSLADDTVLKPTLRWLLASQDAGALDAELAYVTGGLSWHADYNIVAPEQGDGLTVVGWITMENRSGKVFEDASIKLLAGDVNKVRRDEGLMKMGYAARAAESDMSRPVTERTFDEYHMYTLARTTTLHDSETKQVEFVRAEGVKSQRLYVYDGATLEPNQWASWAGIDMRNQPEYGANAQPKVWVMQEFKNSEENGLGMPLPAGRVRFYKQDTDGRLEFTGENTIDHTPRDETLRIYTGNSFDLVGERTRTDFRVDNDKDWAEEAFEIKLRNHKKEPVEIRVVEHLFRWTNWEITQSSQPFTKKDAQTIEFRATVPPDGEQVITYRVHYSW